MNNTLIQRLRGFSLVELMISLALGAFLAIGLISVFLSTKQSYRLQEASSRRLENGRYALAMMQHDIRASAYRGCARSVREVDATNPLAVDITINSLATNAFQYNFSLAVQGSEATGVNTWSPALDASLGAVVSGTDTITLRAPLDSVGVFTTVAMATVADFVSASSAITPAFAANDVVMVSNCSLAEVFQVSGLGAGPPAGTARLLHAAGGPAPGNNTANLSVVYGIGAQVMRIATISYFIRNSTNNTGPALWQRVGNNAAVEVAEGIENMQIQYGIDRDGDLDPDAWVTANNVTGTDPIDMISIRIALLVANTDVAQTRAALTDNTTQYNLLGTNFGPFSDGRLRRVYTSTVTMRNRAK